MINLKSSQATQTRAAHLVMWSFLLLFSFISIFPFAWMISASIKMNSEVFYYPIQWIPQDIQWRNYIHVLTQFNFLAYFKNTAVVSAMITFGTLLISVMAAYAFAKLHFRGSNFLFLLYISTLMLPWQVYMVPQYLIVSKMQLVDSHLGLALTSVFAPFGVFLLKQFFMGIPNDYGEAAKIDGCSHLGICFRIILPMSKPAITSLLLLTFMSAWNDYLAPLIYLKTEKLRTLQIALHYFQGENETNWALLMAGACLSMLPILVLYIFAQKQLMEGMASAGGIKG
ncbi:MAG: carbohydrate ABC transporter permease [Gemmiger sp.]|nr:carbohydrate ABC transporter permease [Gemmiger sp.]